MSSELYKWSKNGMKMIINTDFQLFNKQTNYISDGQVIANTQFSLCIRPYNETECNGINFPIGHLHNKDLENFTITDTLRKLLKEQTENVYLYEFRVFKENRKEVLGHLVIKNGETIYKKLYDIYSLNFSQIQKRANVLDYCEKIIKGE